MIDCSPIVVENDLPPLIVTVENVPVLVTSDDFGVHVIDVPVTVATVVDAEIVIIDESVGPQGPSGPPGIDGGTLTVIAGENISQYSVVRILSDGQGYLADRNDATHGVFVAGVATNSALTGEPVTVRTDGLMSTAPMWTLGPLFVGDVGALISTPPPGTMTDYQLQVAVAVTTSELLVRPQITIFSIQP